jgi:hypothetical protein
MAEAGLTAVAAGAVGGVAMKSGPFCPQPVINTDATARPASPARPRREAFNRGTPRIWSEKTMNGL